MAIVGANNHSPLQAVAINLPKSASILQPPHRCTLSGVQEPVESECTKCHHRTPSGVRGKIPSPHHSVADDRRQRNLHCSSIWHRVPAGRTPSNLRQGLLRPQSEVGDRAGDWRARGTLLINSMLCRWIRSVATCWFLQETHCPFFRGIPAVRFYLPVSVPRLAVGRIPSPDCTPLRSVCLGLLRLCAAGTRINTCSLTPPSPHRCTPSGVQEPVEPKCPQCHHRTP